MERTNGLSCRQIGSTLPEEEWTEVTFGWDEEDPQEAAEKFCRQFVLDGDAPYHVQVRNNRLGEVTEWIVDKVLEPVFHARKRR